MNYRIEFHKQAYKDFKKIKAIPSLYKKTKILLKLLEENPLKCLPNFEKLHGDLKGFYS